MAQPQPYSTTSPPRRHSLRGLATTLTIIFVTFIALDVLATATYIWRGALFDRLADGDLVSETEANVADAVAIGYGIVWTLLFLATAVVFIVWQFRHAVNARTLGVHSGLGRPGWAIGGWFIPIANLILPARQIYRSSRALGKAATSGMTAIIVWWAIALWLSQGLDRAALRIWNDADGFTSEGLRQSATSDYLSAAAAVLDLAAAVLALLIVRLLTQRQNAAFDAWVTKEAPQPHGVSA